MTLAQDAISKTVRASDGAVLVYQYMPDGPCQVINTGTARVYLGTSTSVSDYDGVPAEAGATVVWSTPGVLYAVLDPAATATSTTLILTDRIESWQQSPITVGVEVAQQIAASQLAAQIGAAVPSANSIGGQVASQSNQLGIPPTFKGSRVASGNIGTGGVTSLTVPVDLSQYAGVTIGLGGIAAAQQVSFQWQDGAGGGISARNYLITNVPPPFGGGISVTLPVEGSTLVIKMPNGASTNPTFPSSYSVYASNRLHAEAVGGLSTGVDLSKTQTFTNGSAVPLGGITSPGGVHWARALVSGAGTGYFGYISGDSSGGAPTIYFDLNSTANTNVFGFVALPPGNVGLMFLPTITGTYVAELSLTAGGSPF